MLNNGHDRPLHVLVPPLAICIPDMSDKTCEASKELHTIISFTQIVVTTPFDPILRKKHDRKKQCYDKNQNNTGAKIIRKMLISRKLFTNMVETYSAPSREELCHARTARSCPQTRGL